MLEEYNALIQNGTWSLVPSSLAKNIVVCIWILKLKLNPNGSIENPYTYGKWIPSGMYMDSQVDYHDTFSRVAKPTTIQVIFTIAIARGQALCQLDVKNAFLHGQIYDSTNRFYWSEIFDSCVQVTQSSLWTQTKREIKVEVGSRFSITMIGFFLNTLTGSISILCYLL